MGDGVKLLVYTDADDDTIDYLRRVTTEYCIDEDDGIRDGDDEGCDM
jgi:tagatose-1,6-bisphosphate aldolase